MNMYGSGRLNAFSVPTKYSPPPTCMCVCVCVLFGGGGGGGSGGLKVNITWVERMMQDMISKGYFTESRDSSQRNSCTHNFGARKKNWFCLHSSQKKQF